MTIKTNALRLAPDMLVHALGTLAALSIVGVFGLCVVVPAVQQSIQTNRLHHELGRLDADRAANEQTLQSLRLELADVNAQTASAPIRAFSPEATNTMMARLGEVAASVGMEVDSLEPSSLRSGAELSVMPIRLNARGRYVACQAYLGLLRSQFPDVRIRSINWSASGNGRGVHSLNLELSWIVRK
ncbi:MAG: hypothetical protein QM770_05965 [Tepidisphaeraceae bacterium]